MIEIPEMLLLIFCGVIILGMLIYSYLDGLYSATSGHYTEAIVRTITEDEERLSTLEEENRKLREENATLAQERARTEYR